MNLDDQLVWKGLARSCQHWLQVHALRLLKINPHLCCLYDAHLHVTKKRTPSPAYHCFAHHRRFRYDDHVTVGVYGALPYLPMVPTTDTNPGPCVVNGPANGAQGIGGEALTMEEPLVWVHTVGTVGLGTTESHLWGDIMWYPFVSYKTHKFGG